MQLSENFVLTGLSHWESLELAQMWKHQPLVESQFEFARPDDGTTDTIRVEYIGTGKRIPYTRVEGWVQRFARDAAQGRFHHTSN
jgi:hypothetical protein